MITLRMGRQVHDAVARGYNSGSGIIAEKNRLVAASLVARVPRRDRAVAVADLGVGDGAMLAQLAAAGLPMRATGLDVSRAMLARAAARVPLTTVHAGAEHAARHLPAAAFDLVLAHFILAYVDRAALLAQARTLLAVDGVFSLVTTTGEGGSGFMAWLDEHYRRTRHPLKRIIAAAADRALACSHVPATYADLEADIAAAGLQVQARQTLRVPVSLPDAEAAYRFGFEEGWAANILTVPGLPLGVGEAMARWGVRQGAYPLRFIQVVEMLEIGRALPSADPATDRAGARSAPRGG
ncbi:MAG: class I SAM-dependent methyltransferase [Burkholderiales bacterium]|nr:class I SAM-dependent methyltransferase [Burkholderiales bacterium]